MFGSFQNHHQLSAKSINYILPNPSTESIRDKSGLECDAVVHLKNGRYGLIEIKLGGDKLIEEGAKNLLKLRERIDCEKMTEPAFMMVLCGVAPFAYRRSDDVLVVPIGTLRN